MIEAVLFDIDGTLLDHESASSGSLRALIELERDDLDADGHATVLTEWRRLEALHYETYLRGEIDLAEQRRRRAAGIISHLRLGERGSDELDAWWQRFLDGYRARWRAFDDVEAAVTAAEAAGLGLGVVTNADGPIQRRKLEALGLLERLPAFVASSEAGSAKPEPAIFAAACELAGLPAERVAYVGDRLDTDARGARDAGLLGIWLDRKDEAAALAERGEEPDVSVVRSLSELADALDRA
jgi:putative hydrolase of the HAD superfamily